MLGWQQTSARRQEGEKGNRAGDKKQTDLEIPGALNWFTDLRCKNVAHCFCNAF